MKATIEIEFGNISCVSDSGKYCPCLEMGSDEYMCNLFGTSIAPIVDYTSKFDRRRLKRCKDCCIEWPPIKKKKQS